MPPNTAWLAGEGQEWDYKAMKDWERWLLPLGWILLAWAVLSGPMLAAFHGKWLLLHGLAVVGLCLFCFHRAVVPVFSRVEAGGFALLFVSLLAHMITTSPTSFYGSLSDRVGFLGLALVAWRGFSGRLRWEDFWWPSGIALGGVVGYGLWQLGTVGFSGVMPYYTAGSTFGHTNNAAQFVGLSLLWWWAIPFPRALGPRLFLWSVSAFSLAYLVLSRGRSALVAFALGAALLGYLRFRREGGKAFRVAGAVVVAAALVYGGLQLAKGKSLAEVLDFSIFAAKASPVEFRRDVWTQTLHLIGDAPLGVGVDRFGFAFVPYHREGTSLSPHTLAVSPHNEFLRYPVEDGLPLALFFALALGCLFFRWWRAGGRDREIILPTALFFLFEMLVQFPWQNPVPSYFGALAFGAMAAGVWPRRPFPRAPWARALAGITLLFFALSVGRAAVSRLNETTSDLFWARTACEAMPTNWRACLNYTKVLIKQQQYAPARAELNRMIGEEPWNYGALRNLAVLALREGDALEGCFYIWRYDDIFHGKSDLSSEFLHNCPKKWRDYFQRKRPTQYFRRKQSPKFVPVPSTNIKP